MYVFSLYQRKQGLGDLTDSRLQGEEQWCPGWLAVRHTSGLCIPPVPWCSLTFLIFPTVTMSVPTACILPRMTERLTQTFPHWIPTSPFISLVSVLWPWLKSIHLPVWHPKSRSLFECEYWHCYLSHYLTSRPFRVLDLILVFLSDEWYFLSGEWTWNDDFQRDGDNICILFQATAPGVNCIKSVSKVVSMYQASGNIGALWTLWRKNLTFSSFSSRNPNWKCMLQSLLFCDLKYFFFSPILFKSNLIFFLVTFL